MTYREATAYLFGRLPMFQRQGPKAFKKDLHNIERLDHYLDHPHRAFPAVHIAGTNGKGTVAHLLAGLLQHAGYKTGLYTSPHYKDFRERIKINGQPVSRHYVTDFVHRHRDFIERSAMSFFEVSVGMALACFRDEGVDVAVIETGLGGRLDSTNIITPVLSVITNIGYDHTHFLGNTLPAIAQEKAGIIKPGVPVVIGEYQEEVFDVFRQQAMQRRAPLHVARDLARWEGETSLGLHGTSGRLRLADGTTLRVETGFAGPFVPANLITATAAYQVLRDANSPVLPPLRAGAFKELKQLTGYIGRWTWLSRAPRVLADSAHNRHGIALLARTLKAMRYNRLFYVLGTVRDKEPDYLFELLPRADFYHCAKANIPRGMDAERLCALARARNLPGRAYSSVRQALKAARMRARADDLIVVTGSIFVVAEII